MKALLQRVSSARVEIDGEIVGAIEHGLLVLLGVEKDDGDSEVVRTLERLLAYRVFPDERGRMNNNVVDAKGGLLIVSQFTLAADTQKGTRPSFSSAAAPALAEQLYDKLLSQLRLRHAPIAAGRFGANMQVYLVNDGPVTFLLES
jgi:D-tyrosyl-tRNA(Tyr) deacylase